MVLESLVGLLKGFENLVVAIAVIVISFFIAVIASRYTRSLVASRISTAAAIPAGRAVFILILSIGIIIALAKIGIDLSSILVAGGLIAIAVGFAAQTTITSFLYGLLLYIDRPFRIGDAVSIGNNGGTVEDINVFSVRLRAFDGRYLRIPNDEAFKSVITNFVATKARRVEYQILLPVDADLRRAMEVVKRTLNNHPLVLVEPAPTIFANQATVDGTVLNVGAWVPVNALSQVWAELLAMIREDLVKEGIQLAVPQRVIRMKSE